MAEENTETPVVFISYEWQSQDWTLNLAERLEGDGIHVEIDVWSLKEGEDKYDYMERMVKDPKISKVLMICDARYKAKADDRAGGVGDEAQIVSGVIYEKADKGKFIPIIRDRDEHGNAHVPVFLKPLIYIDLSDPTFYEENYANLVRTIYNKRVHQRPARGKAPSYILNDNAEVSPTTFKFNAFRNALHNNKATAPGMAEDYLEALENILEQMPIALKTDEQKTTLVIRDEIIESINLFLPQRDEYIDFLITTCKYTGGDRYFSIIQQFFARVARFLSLKHLTTGERVIPDNYHFLIPELFIYTITLMAKHDRFKEMPTLLSASYQDASNRDHMNVSTYNVFQPRMDYIERLQSSSASYWQGSTTATVNLFMERTNRKGVSPVDLAGIDLALYLREFLHPSKTRLKNWRQVFQSHLEYDMEWSLPLFIGAAAQNDFQKLCYLLGVPDKATLVEKFNAACERDENAKKTALFSSTVRARLQRLMNLDMLDTM